jgi:hypothetical protein
MEVEEMVLWGLVVPDLWCITTAPVVPAVAAVAITEAVREDRVQILHRAAAVAADRLLPVR